MALINNGDVLYLAAKMRYDGLSDIVNRFTVRVVKDVTEDDGDVLEVCRDYVEAVYAPIIGDIANNVSFENIEVFNATTDNPIPSVTFFTLDTGTSTNPVVGPQLSAYSFARTAVSKHRGAKYWPAMTTAANVDGLITPTVLGHFADVIEAWINIYVHDTLLSTLLPGILATVGLHEGEFIPFVDGVVRSLWSFVDRRKLGVGS